MLPVPMSALTDLNDVDDYVNDVDLEEVQKFFIDPNFQSITDLNR